MVFAAVLFAQVVDLAPQFLHELVPSGGSVPGTVCGPPRVQVNVHAAADALALQGATFYALSDRRLFDAQDLRGFLYRNPLTFHLLPRVIVRRSGVYLTTTGLPAGPL